MKFCLFLLSCFIAVSWQQRNPAYYWAPYQAQRLSNPYTFSSQHQPEFDSYINAPYYYQRPQMDFDKLENIAGRNPVASKIGDGVDGRAWTNTRYVLRNQLATTTAYKIVTSTLTLTSAISCVPFASFYGGSTQSCRRKRDSQKLLAMIEAESNGNEPLQPTSTTSIVEPTAAAEDLLKSSPKTADLESSLAEPHELGSRKERVAQEEVFFRSLYAYTTTSTLTSFSLVTSASKKTVLLGSNLSCLPSGIRVC